MLAPFPLVALAAWVVPGMGYVLLRQYARGITVGAAILAMFVLGILIGGIRVIDAPGGAAGTPILAKPWFIGQFLAGPISFVCNYLANAWEAPYSHARVFEIGTLYTAVAGMLNMMAIIDSGYRAAHEGNR